MRRSDMLTSAGLFLLVIGVAAALWPWAEGPYRALVAEASQAVLATPDVAELGRSPYAGVALFAALTLATPLGWRRRLMALALGVVALVGWQVGIRVALTHATEAIQTGGYGYPGAWLYAAASAGPVIGPVAVWAGLTWGPPVGYRLASKTTNDNTNQMKRRSATDIGHA